MMKVKTSFLYPVLLLLALFSQAKINAQCSPDTTPPIAVCDNLLNFNTDAEFILQAISLDDGSNDNCTDSLGLAYFITTDYQQSILPTTTNITYPAGTVGFDTVAMWVVDEAGNSNKCISTLALYTGNTNCTNDLIRPTLACNPNISVNSSLDISIDAVEFAAAASDNCTEFGDLDFFVANSYSPNTIPTTTSLFYPAGTSTMDSVTLWVVDEAGNARPCFSTVTINSTPNCIDDMIAPTMDCFGPWFITLGPNDQLTISPEDLDRNSTDNCTAQINLARFVSAGTNDPNQYQSSVTYPLGTFGTVFPILTVRDEAGNEATCEVSITITDLAAICANDTLAPNIICQPDAVLPYSGLDYLVVPQAVYSNAFDNCTPDSLLQYFISDIFTIGAPSTQEVIIPVGTIGWTTIYVWAVDEAGNYSYCARDIMVEAAPSNCMNDTTPPIAVCDGPIQLQSDVDITLTALDLDDGSWDNCTDTLNLNYFVTSDHTQTTPPTTTSVSYSAGSAVWDTLALWVVDEAGNANTCLVFVEIKLPPNCDNDTIPPSLSCNQDLSFNSDTSFFLNAFYFIDSPTDECTDNSNLQFFISQDHLQTTPPTTTSVFYPAGSDLSDTLAVWVVDEAGNATPCYTIVHIIPPPPECINDTIAPNMVCNGPLFITLGANDQFSITPFEMDLNSTDNCTSQSNLKRFVSSSINDPNQYQSIITYPIGTTGTVFPLLTIRDLAGNESTCEVAVTIESQCPNDIIDPNIICLSDIVLPYTGLDYVVVPQAVFQQAWDNCTPDSLLNFFVSDENLTGPPPTTEEVIIPEGTISWTTIAVWVVDEAGNWRRCESRIRVGPDPVACQNDTIPPIVVCESFVTLTTVVGQDYTLNAQMLNDGSIDNCTLFPNLEFFVSTDGTLSAPPSTTTLNYPSGSNLKDTVHLWVVDEAGNFNTCATIVEITDYFFFGQVFNDIIPNCELDSLEFGIGNIPIRYSIDGGQTYTTVNSSANGTYNFSVNTNPTTTPEITIELLLPNGMSASCPTTYTIDLATVTDAYEQNFAANLATDCNFMTVDISTFGLRRCLPSTYYVNYCNNSTFTIDSVELIVTLPPSQVIQSVGLPYTDIGNNQLQFELGTVASGYCNQFEIIVVQDCTTPLGATKCVQAEISPYNCDDPMLSYAGADLEVTAICDESNELVTFSITNVGDAAMSEAREYIVIEDVIMYMQDPIQLGVNETKEINFAANGSTWRIEIEQEADHPSLSNVSSAVEGCVDFGSMGLINVFSQPDADPYIAIDCQEVIGSFDPNDKRAFPEGYAEDHFILKNTSIEYNIRFQNTGTDTAFTVRLEDQLDENLDWTSIAAGASSHPYRMELRDGGKVIFHFENINLPDSTVNKIGSHGFVQFRINQLPDNALGTVIENTADIYFDFNEAIVTNTVFHTIGDNFILSSTIETATPEIEVRVAPNPFNQYAMITLEGALNRNATFELYNVYGQLIKHEKMEGNQYQLMRDDLSAGTFIFRIINEDGMLANGKLVIQ